MLDIVIGLDFQGKWKGHPWKDTVYSIEQGTQLRVSGTFYLEMVMRRVGPTDYNKYSHSRLSKHEHISGFVAFPINYSDRKPAYIANSVNGLSNGRTLFCPNADIHVKRGMFC